MALSDKQISRIWDKHTIPVFDKTGINPIVFARAIEAEVRKQDEALIRQLVAALEGYRRNHNDMQPCDAERAGRAWLEGAQ